MLIHRIELSNVKSFARADIPLGPGLTAITGENGAGKSTILEAIGYALFGFLPYRPLSGFMRHGEAAAEVAVEFTSGLDDRRYRVTRRLRRARARASGALAADAQPQAAILDVELGTTFAQRAEEVRTFLTEHLGDDGIAPEVVFEHVVGVPQGRLTADFLDPPNIRKNRFDPLLRTHEFQQAYEALLALVRHFELRRQAHATRAAALEGELKQVAALATRLEAAEAQARGVAAQLEAAASDLTQAGDAVRAHEDLRTARDAAAHALAEAGRRHASAQEHHRRLAALAAQASAAAARVAASEADHRTYGEADKALRALGPVERQHTDLLQLLSERSAAEARARADHEQAQARLAEAQAAQREVEALTPLAAREAELTAQLGPLHEALIAARAQAALLAGAAQRRDLALAELSAVRAAAQAELARREPEARVAGELDARRARLAAMQTERATTQAQLDSDAVMQDVLVRTRACPFWDQPCRNLPDIPDVPAVFARRAAAHLARLAELEAAIEAGTARVAEATAASTAVAHVPTLRAQLARFEAEFGPPDAGAAARHADAPSRARAHATPSLALAERLAQVEERLRAAAADLPKSHAADREVERLESEIAGLDPHLQPVRGSMAQLPALRLRAARAAEASQQAEQAADARAAALAAQQATGAELATLEPALRRLDHLRQTLDHARQGHEAYLRNVEPATELPARQADAAHAQDAERQAQAALEAAAPAAQRAAVAFDAEALRAAQAARDAARERQAQLAERARATQAEIERLRSERIRLEAVAETLAAERVAMSRADACTARSEALRGVIRQAGPLVTQALLGDVSLAAAELFGDILGDRSGQLRWTPDYDVEVTRGAYTQGFGQLSGGEQMSAALAVRLALLRELLKLDVAFFDEPTQHLDGARRSNLTEQVERVRGFSQLVVISHDDSFERLADQVIRVRKVDGRSVVEAA